ncbi:tyrosinase cofactor [Streptantibioticus rubrisoli]|uniref:Tyrosinase cofactor n=1 Tax=Streptantibioticus rubrisoli TaxID=1387313 RepID=A0ABT1P7V7_9ACTN|nr:tyrosinase cofactor [Streptantibioticus rubrisoli]MCQ4041457.1 tyrosinase cofactor [Streptantibioticus rubrisoli]
MKRRDAVKLAIGSTAAAALSAVGVAAGEEFGFGGADRDEYVEEYRGRRIQIVRAGELPEVYIDGRQLHLMRLDEGRYLSAMCHYEFCPTPLAAARKAVEELRGANLIPLGHSAHT